MDATTTATHDPVVTLTPKAVEMVKSFLQVVGEGECELRQIYEAPADLAATG